MPDVGFLGPEGTFSQEALRLCRAAAGWTPRPYGTISQVYEAALAGEVDAGLVPIENSLEGSVNQTLDLLVHRGGLRMAAEVVLPVRQHLMAAQGTSLADVKGVLSHPQALAQCAAYLQRTFPGVPQEAANSTAQAARRVRDMPGWAAIAPEVAAEIYGLRILSRSIQDVDENYTRFVLLARADAPPTGCDKTSIAFVPPNRPGGLYHLLGEFASRAINLTKIESRPARRGLGDYIILVDFEGHRADPHCQAALEAVKRRVDVFKLFGSYPRWQNGG